MNEYLIMVYFGLIELLMLVLVEILWLIELRKPVRPVQSIPNVSYHYWKLGVKDE